MHRVDEPIQKSDVNQTFRVFVIWWDTFGVKTFLGKSFRGGQILPRSKLL